MLNTVVTDCNLQSGTYRILNRKWFGNFVMGSDTAWKISDRPSRTTAFQIHVTANEFRKSFFQKQCPVIFNLVGIKCCTTCIFLYKGSPDRLCSRIYVSKCELWPRVPFLQFSLSFRTFGSVLFIYLLRFFNYSNFKLNWMAPMIRKIYFIAGIKRLINSILNFSFILLIIRNRSLSGNRSSITTSCHSPK